MKEQREILFRGKNIDGNWIESMTMKEYPYGLHIGKGYSLAVNNVWENIAPQTLSQFTGLKDSEGVKIFEGDIVKFYTFYYDSGNTADWFGAEPQNSRFVEEFYIIGHKGVVSFQDGTFGVRYENGIFRTLHSILSKRDFSEGFYEWDRMIKEVIEDDDRIESIEDFEKLLSSLSVIGNIHDNPELKS